MKSTVFLRGVKAMAHCSNCGEELEESYYFCPKCGVRMGAGIDAGLADPSKDLKKTSAGTVEEMNKALARGAEETRKTFKRANALKNSTNFKIIAIFLTTIGAIMLVWYLRFVETGVPIQLLFTGVILVSFGDMLAFVTLQAKSRNFHFLFVLFLTTFILINMYDIRFGSLQGSDVLYEFQTARITSEQGTWALERPYWNNYLSSISVSLVPSLLSEIMGLNLFLTFEIVMRLVSALLPLMLFVTTKEIFRNTKLAGLSALLFSQLYFNFTLLPSLMRQFIAEMAFVLTIFILMKMYRKKSSDLWAWAILLTISVFGLVAYHYTVAYWAAIVFLFLFLFEFVVSSAPKRILQIIKGSQLVHGRTLFRVEYFLFFLVLLISWTVVTNLAPFVNDLHNQFYLLSGGKPSASGQYQVNWLVGSPAGPVTTAWFLLEGILAAIGFLYFIFRVPKKTRHLPWAIGALVMFAAVAIWINPSFSGGLIYLDRIYLIGSIFFTAFSAGLLLKVDSKFKYLIVIFLLLNLPINMLLIPHQRYVLYHRESDVAPADELLQNIVREPSFVFSQWLVVHSSYSYEIQADNPTGDRSLFYASSQYSTPLDSTEPTGYELHGLFFFHYINLEYGVWQTGERSHISFSMENLQKRTVTYNNGQALLVSFP